MPRPARFGEPASASIRVRVTPDQKRDLRRVARENRTDMAGVIREAVNTYVADYRDRDVFRSPKPATP
jgi:predicted transcriptional regulator